MTEHEDAKKLKAMWAVVKGSHEGKSTRDIAASLPDSEKKGIIAYLKSKLKKD